LQEITSATRIGPRFLEALENEDWEKLPGGVFNRGFVRSIARYLGLDEEGLLAEYDLAHGAVVPPTPERGPGRIPAAPRWVPLAALLVSLIVLATLITGGIYAWRRYAAHRAAKQTLAAPAQAVPASPAAQSPAPATDSGTPQSAGTPAVPAPPSLDLFVSLSATTRIRILADGKLLFDGELPAGENRHFSANEDFEVTAADSSGVLLELNGQAMPPLGAPGTSGTMRLGRKDLRQVTGGNSQP